VLKEDTRSAVSATLLDVFTAKYCPWRCGECGRLRRCARAAGPARPAPGRCPFPASASRTTAIRGEGQPAAPGMAKAATSATPAQLRTRSLSVWGRNFSPPKFISSSTRPSTRSRPLAGGMQLSRVADVYSGGEGDSGLSWQRLHFGRAARSSGCGTLPLLHEEVDEHAKLRRHLITRRDVDIEALERWAPFLHHPH
jgi:hypothetical protein